MLKGFLYTEKGFGRKQFWEIEELYYPSSWEDFLFSVAEYFKISL